MMLRRWSIKDVRNFGNDGNVSGAHYLIGAASFRNKNGSVPAVEAKD